MELSISRHITYAEATRTSTGLPNDPDAKQLYAMQSIASNVFEPLRAWVGGPIQITSFFRCAAVNKKVGGASNSQHVKGEAMDLDMDMIKGSKSNADLFRYIRANLPFDQLIWEFGNTINPNWVHVSYRASGGNRGQVLIARKSAGRTVYLEVKAGQKV